MLTKNLNKINLVIINNQAKACYRLCLFLLYMYNQIEKLASAIRNDIVAGLRGYHTNYSMSTEQLEQDIVDERLQILKEYSLKGVLPTKDLYISINCIPIDCKGVDRCRCNTISYCQDSPVAHFEIPQILNDYGSLSIDYIGSTDRQLPFIYYTSATTFRYHKYRKRGKNKPYVWIDTTPNENGMYDCFVYNAPLLKQVSISAIFKDLRQLDGYGCCSDLQDDNMSFINNEIKKRVTQKKIQYYRSFAPSNLPNDQAYQPG